MFGDSLGEPLNCAWHPYRSGLRLILLEADTASICGPKTTRLSQQVRQCRQDESGSESDRDEINHLLSKSLRTIRISDPSDPAKNPMTAAMSKKNSQ